MEKIIFEKPKNVYEMCSHQLSQIDCHILECKFNKGAGKCSNQSPAITLNNKIHGGGFVCWSKIIK